MVVVLERFGIRCFYWISLVFLVGKRVAGLRLENFRWEKSMNKIAQTASGQRNEIGLKSTKLIK
jgi:hypothetical protein